MVRRVSATSLRARPAHAPPALTGSRWRLQQTSPRSAPPDPPGGWSFVQSSRSWGSSSFRSRAHGGHTARCRVPCRPFLPLDALPPLGAFTPCRRGRSPSWLTSRAIPPWSPKGSTAGLPVTRFTRPLAPLAVDSPPLALLPRSPLRVRVAGASRPLVPASRRHTARALRRLEPVGCASPRRCRLVSTSGYSRRVRTGLPRSPVRRRGPLTSGVLPGLVHCAWSGPFASSVGAAWAPP